MYGIECPHDRDVMPPDAADCNASSKCPSGVRPHTIWRGNITNNLHDDIPDASSVIGPM